MLLAAGVAAALAIAQGAAAERVVSCRVPGDLEQREWSLERVETTGDPGRKWWIVFTGRVLDTPRTALPLTRAIPVVGPAGVTLSYMSANGGLAIEWRATDGASVLDLHTNFELEVNVEPDLDPAVEHMNTHGPLAVTCTLAPPHPGTPAPPHPGTLAPPHPGTLAPPPRRGATEVAPYHPAPSHLRTLAPSHLDNPAPSLMSEWVAGIGSAWSVGLYQSQPGRRYGVQTISWGRELTRDSGPGMLKGRFAWAMEVMPVFRQTRPTGVYGFGVAPIVWRWNFVPRPRWSAFGEMALGGLWSSAPIPEETTRANFTAHWGAGLRLRASPRGSVVVAYRFQHISNGNQLPQNPGVNSHLAFVGVSVTGTR